jgi:hypothetical protein
MSGKFLVGYKTVKLLDERVTVVIAYKSYFKCTNIRNFGHLKTVVGEF